MVDFRCLNENCPTDAYPIPALDQLIDEFKDAAYLGAIDLKSGYWQVPLLTKDCEKTAFITAFGLYHYLRVPFGYRNAPAHFMHCIDQMLN